jgi:predicted nucleic acid-binding protein
VGFEALTDVLTSTEYGHVMTSDYIYDEVVTLTHRQTGDVDARVEFGRRIRGDRYPSAIELLYTLPLLFDRVVAVH